MKCRITLLPALLLLTFGCGGGGSSSSSSSGALSGNWQMTLQKSGTTKFPKTLSGSLMQTNNAITGSLILTDTPCSGVGSVSGSLSGSNVAMVVTPSGVTVNLTGTLQSNQMMGGNFNILSNGCSGSQSSPLAGTWTAQPVTPLSGTYTGMFTSHEGVNYPVTVQLTQGSNTGASNISLTGTLTVTDYCFTGANIVGVVTGTSVVMNLLNSAGVQVGQVTGTSSFDGMSIMPAKYTVLPQGKGGVAPCVDGDSGMVSLSL